MKQDCNKLLVIVIKCTLCSSNYLRSRFLHYTGRTLTIYPQEQYETLLAARKRQETDEFTEKYGERAGIERTISQGVRAMGLRHIRGTLVFHGHICNMLRRRQPLMLFVCQLASWRRTGRDASITVSSPYSYLTSPTGSFHRVLPYFTAVSLIL